VVLTDFLSGRAKELIFMLNMIFIIVVEPAITFLVLLPTRWNWIYNDITILKNQFITLVS
jgi:hypothetical protein